MKAVILESYVMEEVNVKIKIHWEGLQESGTPNQRFASERSM